MICSKLNSFTSSCELGYKIIQEIWTAIFCHIQNFIDRIIAFETENASLRTKITKYEKKFKGKLRETLKIVGYLKYNKQNNVDCMNEYDLNYNGTDLRFLIDGDMHTCSMI